MKTNNTGLLAIALIVVVGAGAFFFSFKGKEEMKKATAPLKQNTQSVSQVAAYKDGEYKETGEYTSPAGAEQIDVDVTLKNDIVTEVEVTAKAENPKSKYMQGVFVENFKQFVVGKNIKDLNLGKVAGSSLTPQGFNDALTKIKTAAKT